MKALVKYELGPGNMEIRDIPEPKPEAMQVKIEVKEAGIQVVILGMKIHTLISPGPGLCHSSLHQGLADTHSPGIRTNFQIV